MVAINPIAECGERGIQRRSDLPAAFVASVNDLGKEHQMPLNKSLFLEGQ
jgi:hypothetical protein